MSALKVLLGFAVAGGLAAAVMSGGKDEAKKDDKPGPDSSGGDDLPSRVYTYHGYTVTIGAARRLGPGGFRWRVYDTKAYQQGLRDVKKSATADGMAEAEDNANAWIDAQGGAPDMTVATPAPTQPSPQSGGTTTMAGDVNLGVYFAGVDPVRDVAMDLSRTLSGYRWRIYPEEILPPLEAGDDDVDRIRKVDPAEIEASLLASGTAHTDERARDDAEDALDNLEHTPAGTVEHGVLMSPDCRRLQVIDSLRWIAWASKHLERMGPIQDQDPLDVGRHLLTGAFPDCEFPEDLDGMGLVTPGGVRDLYDLLAKIDDAVIQPLKANPGVWAAGEGMGTPRETAAAIFVSQAVPDQEPPGFVHKGWQVELTDLPGSMWRWEAWRLGKRDIPPQRKGTAMGAQLAVKRAIKAIDKAEAE